MWNFVAIMKLTKLGQGPEFLLLRECLGKDWPKKCEGKECQRPCFLLVERNMLYMWVKVF
jgi:hypothetical protein